MTFEQPAWLLLALLVGVLWWLHRQLSLPAVVRVPSLLPYRDAATDAPPASASRRMGLDFWLLALGMVALAAAAAGPILGGGGVPAAYVVVDRSASMARGGSGALVLACERLSEAVPDVRVDLHPLDGPGVAASAWRVGESLDPHSVDWAPRADVADGLPGALASHLGHAGAGGYPGVVIVTDRELPPIPGVVVVRSGTPPSSNVAFSGATLDVDGASMRCHLQMYGDASAEVGVAGARGRVRVEPGGAASVTLPAPSPGGSLTVSLAVVDDDAPSDLDDRMVVRRQAWTGRVLWMGPDAPRLRAALELMRLEIVEDPEAQVDLRVVVHGEIAGGASTPTLYVRPARTAPPFARSDAGDEFPESARLRGEGDVFPALPSPSVRLASAGRLTGGTAALSDDAGSLVVAAPGVVATTLDPDAPASTWHEDPSFPAFVAAAVAHLRGAEELEVEGLVPVSERVPLPAAADPAPNLRERLAAVVRRESAEESPAVGGPLAALGALLFAVGGTLLWRRAS